MVISPVLAWLAARVLFFNVMATLIAGQETELSQSCEFS